MKLNTLIATSLFASTLTYTQVHADTTYDAANVVSETQLSQIVSTLLKIAPSGTKTTKPAFKGFFSVNNPQERYLTLVDINSVTFKVTTKVIFSLSSNVTISMAAVFPDLNCNNPQITRVVVNGTNSLLDGDIRSHVQKNAVSIIRDNFIAQTDLIKYCKVKPKPASAPLFEPMDNPYSFQFELADVE